MTFEYSDFIDVIPHIYVANLEDVICEIDGYFSDLASF